MDEIQILISETAEDICDNFCKFSGTGTDNKCVWMQTHEGNCPFDNLMKEVGLC